MDSLNTDRVDGASDPAFLDNGFLDDAAQNAAVNFASCDGCSNPLFPAISPSISPSADEVVNVTVSGGALAGRPDRAVQDLEAYDSSAAFSLDTYGAIGFYTKGTTSYVSLMVATFSGTPTNETRPGTVKLPSVIRVGQAIVPVIAGFSPLPTSDYTYTWTSNGATVSHVRFYPPVASDLGHQLRLIVSDQNSGYSDGVAESALSTKVLAGILDSPKTVVPVGARNVGEPLDLNLGDWSGDLAYQWYRNGVKITGATLDEYVQVSADRGKKISVRITASYPGYTTISKTSAGNIVTGYPLLTSTPYPTISGQPQFSNTLTVDPGSWGPNSPKLTYQWRADGKAIPGATHSTLYLGGAELGASITVTVTGSETGYATASRTSAATTDIELLRFIAYSNPVVSGTFTPGHTLTASIPEAWTPTASEYLYQWYLNNVPVSGANKKTFKLPSSSAGEDVRVNVIGLRPDYQPFQATSSNTYVS